MPSPFPGMAPYLEGSLWTTLHFALSAEIVRDLAPRLRRRYLVLPAERRPITEVWLIALADPLPVVPVPLLPGDSDVPLDLQAIFTITYDLLGYDLAVDYTHPPEMLLEGDAAEWVAARLTAAGYRPNDND